VKNLIPLSDCISLFGGGTPSKQVPEYWNGEIPWASVKDLKSSRLKQTQDSITELGLKNSSSKLVKSGTLLIATRMAVGKAAITDIDVAINQDLKAIVCKENIDVKYLFYFLSSCENEFAKVSSGATVKGIKLKHILDLKIPLPPLTEQKQIAAILDAADSLRQKDQQLVEHYTSLSQSLFLEMFGDPETNSKGYEQKKLEELTTLITDGTHHTPAYTEEGVPFLRVTDITESNNSKKFISQKEHLELIKRCRPERNDILYTKNGTIGVGKIVDWDYEFSIFVSLCLLKPKHEIVEVKYLNFFLNTPFALNQAAKHSKVATIKNLHLVEIKKMKIPYPSIEEQREFVSKFEKIEQQKQQAQTNLQNSEALFNSLLQRAFTGELTADRAA
jgi:type I restriction enzyme S subunit